MIPFAQPDILHPANHVDYRIAQNHGRDDGLSWSFSRAIFQLVSRIESLLFSK